MEQINLNGKLGLIIGASGAIGSAIAELGAAHGAALILHHQDASDLPSIKRLAVQPQKIVSGDLRTQAGISGIIDQVKEESLDFLVIASGIAPFVPWELMTMEIFKETFDVNVFAPVRMLFELEETVMDRGTIVVLTSTGAYFGCEDQLDYNASKAALNSLVQSWALRFGKRGVRVVGVAPGRIDTPMARRAPATNSRYIPLQRLGWPVDVADLVLFLVSDLNQYITGTVVDIDGGRRANGHPHLF